MVDVSSFHPTILSLNDTINSNQSIFQSYQDYLKQGQEKLDQLFIERLKQPENSIKHLLQARASLIDTVINHAWDQLGGNTFSASLIAVGGYGRKEMHPYSDIDLMVLLDEEPTIELQAFLEKFLTLLWDLQLKIGHSVRPIYDCLKRAGTDHRIYTTLLETRFITGCDRLAEKLTKALAENVLWADQEFIKVKVEEQKRRHQKYHETGHNLEPNVKSSPGGLRDLQMLMWIAKHYFGNSNLEILTKTNFLRKHELSELKNNYNLLLSIRYGLHTIAKREENRLIFDYQRALSALFGFKNNSVKLAVEQFMQSYYRAVFSISSLNELLIQHYNDIIISPEKSPLAPQYLQPNINVINRRFQIRNQTLEARNDDVFKLFPEALIEIFVLAANHQSIKGIHANTMRLIRDHIYLIDENFQQNHRATKLFIRLMQSPYSFNQLRRMRRYGVLGRYLPEFKRIIGQMQHDLFHVYTVDAHTLQVIRYLNFLHRMEGGKHYQLATEIFPKLKKLEILYIAALYHDIGKGRGGDHSLLGFQDVSLFCKRHKMNEQDTQLISWLVKHHLLFSQTAQGKDISDPNVIQAFARKVNNVVKLDHLYILTVADINATNPTLWTGWRDTLLRQLYTRTLAALKRGLEQPLDKIQTIENKRTQVTNLLIEQNIDLSHINPIWDQLDDEYFLQFTTEAIVWHSIEITKHQSKKQSKRALATLTSNLQTETGGSHILLFHPNQTINFVAVLNGLEQLELSIQEVYLANKSHDFDLSFYTVLETNHQPINQSDAERVKTINQLLKRALVSPNKLKAPQRRLSRRIKHFVIKTETALSCDIDNSCSILELKTTDRPGLLAEIARVFKKFNIYLENAKISTLGDRVEDVFFITDNKFSPLTDANICRELIETIEQRIDNYMFDIH